MPIKAVKQKKLAPLDDEFAKDCGAYSSLEELKDEASRRDGNDPEEEISRSRTRITILKRFVETHHFDLPDSSGRAGTDRYDSSAHGNSDERSEAKWIRPKNSSKRQKRLSSFAKSCSPDATRRVKIGLILEAIAEKEGIRVEEADVVTEVRTIGADD